MIDDVSRKQSQWIELVEATVDLLPSVMLLLWMDHGSEPGEDDSVERQVDRVRAALAAMGLPQQSMPDFYASVEKHLREDIPPRA